ncbi:MAG: DMT family transporter [Chloroflexota bacterium]
MNGILISILSGITFGLFQTVNRQAGKQANVYQSTFVLLLVSSLVLGGITAVSQPLSLLQNIPALAVLYFALAALIHFFVGWTLLSISQQRVGAARTSALLGTMPLWATVMGVFFFDEFLSAYVFVGIGLIIVGTYIVSSGKKPPANSAVETGLRASLFALGTAVCFASSAIFIRYGLVLLPSPLIGVTIGMIVVTVLYGALLWFRPFNDQASVKLKGKLLWLQILAGVLVAVATWWRWMALDLTSIAVVVSLSRLSVPTVLLLSPFFIGQQWEHVTRRVWIGAGVIIAGALVLTFS